MGFQDYNDKLQIAALQSDTPEADNAREQMKLLEANNQLLQKIVDNSQFWRSYTPAWSGM